MTLTSIALTVCRRTNCLVLWLSVLLATIGQTTATAAPDADLWPQWLASDETSVATIDHSVWQRFLDRYVETDASSNVNLVSYVLVTDADRLALRDYLAMLQARDPRRYSRRVQLAYWINLYNAATVDLVLRNPNKRSILRMGEGLLSIGPWEDEILEVAGVALTLNDVEHRILRPIWQDRRVHFALNCASISCPNLAKVAYTAENVNRLLSENESAYINDPRGVHFNSRGRLELSRLFDWYLQDFAATPEELIEYLAQHANEPLRNRLRSYDRRIRYEYDWGLNAAY